MTSSHISSTKGEGTTPNARKGVIDLEKTAFNSKISAGTPNMNTEFLGNAIDRISLGVTLGYRRNHDRIFQLNEDRYRHTVILGRTGSGKSNHMLQLERQDIQSDAGVIVVATHDEDAIYPASCIPAERLSDSLIVDFGNRHFLPCLNPLDVDPNDSVAIDRAVSKTIELITSNSQHDWTGPRFDQPIRMAMYLLLSSDNETHHSILSIARCLTDPEFVSELAENCFRRDVVNYWSKEYALQTKSNGYGDFLTWLTSKLADFQTDRTLRILFRPGKRTLDLKRVVNEGQVLIALIPEHRLSATATKRIRSWFSAELKDAVMDRSPSEVDTTEASYLGAFGGQGSPTFNPCHIYIDEFEKMASPLFASLLAEARKNCVSFTLAFQSLSQMEVYDKKTGVMTWEMLLSIFANVGTFVCYQMGKEDTQAMAQQLHVEPERLEEIERYKPLASVCLDNERTPLSRLDVEKAPDVRGEGLKRLAMRMISTGVWQPIGRREKLYAKECEIMGDRMCPGK